MGTLVIGLRLLVAGALALVVVVPGPAGANHEGLQRELRELRDEIRRGNDEQEFRDQEARMREYRREQEREHVRSPKGCYTMPGTGAYYVSRFVTRPPGSREP